MRLRNTKVTHLFFFFVFGGGGEGEDALRGQLTSPDM